MSVSAELDEISIASSNSNEDTWCKSFSASFVTFASIYKDSYFIIQTLQKQQVAKRWKKPMIRLFILRSIWLFLALLCELSISFPFGWIMNALQEKNKAEFQKTITMFICFHIVAAPVLAIDRYLTNFVYVRFRAAVSDILLHRYHHNHNYYYMLSCDSVDNPGQRLEQDVDNWTWGLSTFSVLLVQSILRLIGWCIVLWYIGASLIVYGFAFATVVVIFGIVVFSAKLAWITVRLTYHTADFRAGIIRTRDNGETVAFYGAYRFEKYWSSQRLKKLLHDLHDQARWQAGLELLHKVTKAVGTLLPLCLLAPAFMSGKMEFGAVMQSCYAFNQLLLALTTVINQIEKLSNIQAGGQRVSQVLVAMDQIEEERENPRVLAHDETITPRSNSHTSLQVETAATPLTIAGASTHVYRGITLEYFDTDSNEQQSPHVLTTSNVSIIVPNTNCLLLHNLNLQVQYGQNVLIVGASGAGKSSLLRVLCGLWKSGGGTVRRLPDSDCMFVPQKPYLPVLPKNKNTLVNQLLFPKHWASADNANDGSINGRMSVPDLHRILGDVNLSYITKYDNRSGHSNERSDSKDWSKLLSLGEQQRLGFGRVLAEQPSMVYLDESTSALDDQNQAMMYRMLQKHGITYISVGHRTNLVEFHDTILEIVGDGSWKLWTQEEYLDRQQQ